LRRGTPILRNDVRNLRLRPRIEGRSEAMIMKGRA